MINKDIFLILFRNSTIIERLEDKHQDLLVQEFNNFISDLSLQHEFRIENGGMNPHGQVHYMTANVISRGFMGEAIIMDQSDLSKIVNSLCRLLITVIQNEK